MKQRTLDEMITYFNQQVDQMDIDRKYKIQLLGMIAAIGFEAQKRKTGRWIGRELGYCSCCGHEGCASDIWSGCKKGNMFCPNCGARMEEES